MRYSEAEYLGTVAQVAEKGGVEDAVREVIEGILEEGREKQAWGRACALLEEGRIRGKVVLKNTRLRFCDFFFTIPSAQGTSSAQREPLTPS